MENPKIVESFEKNTQEDGSKEGAKEDGNEKETFIWSEKAIMLFLELYREREHAFTSGLKRHSKLWSEIASDLQKSNYNVSGVQTQNKMSRLKRSYKKIKDSNAKSGNHNSSWTYYSVMDSLFGEKSWVSPPALASSDGPSAPNASLLSTSCPSASSSASTFECSNTSPKAKKRKVEVILDSYISDLRSNRDQMKEERRKERLEKEAKREQRWEINRTERKEMHKETSEIQRTLVHLLSKLVEKENKPR